MELTPQQFQHLKSLFNGHRFTVSEGVPLDQAFTDLVKGGLVERYQDTLQRTSFRLTRVGVKTLKTGLIGSY